MKGYHTSKGNSIKDERYIVRRAPPTARAPACGERQVPGRRRALNGNKPTGASPGEFGVHSFALPSPDENSRCSRGRDAFSCSRSSGVEGALPKPWNSPGVFLPFKVARSKTGTGTVHAGCVLLELGLDGCEVRLCGLCAFVRPRVPCVPCVCPGSPRCLFTGTVRKMTRGASRSERMRATARKPTPTHRGFLSLHHGLRRIQADCQ